MKELEVVIKENMIPTDEWRLGSAEFGNKTMEEYVQDFLHNRPNPFNQLITVYAIRVSKNKVKKVICVPDVQHNNVIMLDAKMEHTDDGTIMRLQFSGYCRGCKVNFFVEE